MGGVIVLNHLQGLLRKAVNDLLSGSSKNMDRYAGYDYTFGDPASLFTCAGNQGEGSEEQVRHLEKKTQVSVVNLRIAHECTNLSLVVCTTVFSSTTCWLNLGAGE